MTHPDRATLNAWSSRWHAIKLAAYRELVASYTPEQRAIIARMTQAARNEKLCGPRAKYPEGTSQKRGDLVAWPEEPPA